MQISVIIPTYKPQEYLWQCLDSLAGQTLPKDQWEVILVLNGPKEPCYSSIQKYIANLPVNIQFYYSEQASVSNARNIGLDNAKGEYITFIDDDDHVSPTYLQALLEKASPETLALSNAISYSDECESLPYCIADEYRHYATQHQIPFYQLRKYFQGPCMKLIHKNIIGSRRFNVHFRNGEDSLFIFTISDAIHFVDFASADAIYYRYIRPASAYHSQKSLYRILNSIRLMHEYTKIFFFSSNKYNFRFYVTRILGAIHSFFA